MSYSAGDVLSVAVDLDRGRVWYGRVYAPPLPVKLSRRSRRRHRGRVRRVWEKTWFPMELTAPVVTANYRPLTVPPGYRPWL